MKRPLYVMFNVIYQVIICWVLIILNAYYNDLIIPENLAHSHRRIGVKMLITLIEGVVLISIAYAINNAVLSDTDNKVSRKNVANKTGKVQLVITVCFILAMILN